MVTEQSLAEMTKPIWDCQLIWVIWHSPMIASAEPEELFDDLWGWCHSIEVEVEFLSCLGSKRKPCVAQLWAIYEALVTEWSGYAGS